MRPSFFSLVSPLLTRLSSKQNLSTYNSATHRVMLPTSLHHPLPPSSNTTIVLKQPKSPTADNFFYNHFPDRKNLFHFVSTHPRTWLLFTILLLQVFLLFFFFMPPSFPLSTFHRQLPLPAPSLLHFPPLPQPKFQHPQHEYERECNYGKVYVYDLPSSLNTDLFKNCQDFACDAYANDGLGQRVPTRVAGVVPDNITDAWYSTDQFASEIIFHKRMLSHQCRTTDPDSANAFYIPFYGGLILQKYIFDQKYSYHDRDQHCDQMLRWVQDQPYYKRSNGWDHFIVFSRITWDFRRSKQSKDEDWGSSCIYMPAMKNITRLLIERNPWDYFDVGVPYPTGFHPRSESDMRTWQNFVRTRRRKTLFSFAGATRGYIKDDFRGLLLNQCLNESSTCRVVDCGGNRCKNGSSAILEAFLDSDFCLQPRGDSFTRRSIFDCMVAGSIPVFFWKRTAYYQYEWFLPGEPESYSVFVDRNDVKNGTSIREVLQRFKRREIRRMRDKIVEYIPKFVYAEPKEGLGNVSDAFDVAVDEVLRRFVEGYRWK